MQKPRRPVELYIDAVAVEYDVQIKLLKAVALSAFKRKSDIHPCYNGIYASSVVLPLSLNFTFDVFVHSSYAGAN